MKWIVDVLNKGDLIRVKRTFYYHFGIYIGNDEVIHFSGETGDLINFPENVSIRKSSISFFASDGLVEKASYSLKDKMIKRSNDEIIKLAKKRIGEHGYDFLRNNCEDFAYSCVFKKRMKTQIDEYRKKIGEFIK